MFLCVCKHVAYTPLLNFLMPLVSFYIYSAEGTCRTKIFACATTNASFCVDNWNHALVAASTTFAFTFL